jgi:acyl-CoA synthetase (AMP-forming)/AMP-acid ligase II
MSHNSHTDASPEDRQAMLSGAGLLAGPPVPGLALRIVVDRWGTPRGPYTTEQFAAECLPAGTPGEIVVSGEHVLSGYLHGRGDEETKCKVDGVTWHRTGDAGYLDDRGRVWLLGRCVARIEDAHGAVYPFAVEAAAYTNPGVRRAALVARDGRRLLAVELSQRSATAGLRTLREQLAWAHVAEVRVFERIPVDSRHNAKIDYPALNRLLDGGRRPDKGGA